MTRLSTVVIEVVSLALGLFCFREGALSNSYLHRLFCRRSDVKTSQENEDILVWAPNENLSDSKLDEYIAVARDKHGYNMEQALGMLFWHDHDIEEAMMDLPNFTPLRDEWSDVDKILFENGFTWHGKNFQRIHQMLPNKTFASIIKYYYEWKMNRPKSKVKARQARKQKRKQEGSGGKVGGDLNVPNPANPEIEPRKKKQKKK